MNHFGSHYRIELLGSSHGDIVGVVIEGIPIGIKLDLEEIQDWLLRRKPGQSRITTPRNEKDTFIIRTGLFQGKTNGQPLLAYVENKDTDSKYYNDIKDTPRPGHADYPAYIKYKGFNDYRGGGSFSGRMTIALVIAGAIARQIIKKVGVEIVAYTKEIGAIKVN